MNGFSPLGFFGPRQHDRPFWGKFPRKKYSASFLRPGNGKGRQPACSPERAASLEVMTRQRQKKLRFKAAMLQINKVAGGEPRAKRRSMAWALQKRMGQEIGVK